MRIQEGRNFRAGDVELDAAQRAAADHLAALLDRRGRPRRGSGGVYLYGPPGRGKTMLMDQFFGIVVTKPKRRWHFHEFFAQLHAAAATVGSVGDAVTRLIGDVELICFDEFHVHDIGDAMLIARLLDALFTRRIPLVVTSNYPPTGLLPNPLFHDRFVPTIARITERMTVVAVDGPQDYRRLRAGAAHRHEGGTPVVGGGPPGRPLVPERAGAPAWCSDPITPDLWSSSIAGQRQPSSGRAGWIPRDRREVRAEGADVPTGFAAGSYLVGGAPAVSGRTAVRVGAREIPVRTAASGALVADFADLCGTRRSAADYLALAARFERWVVVGVPLLRTVSPDRVMRWVNLVDVLYDADRTLTVHATVPLAELAAGVTPVAGVADLGRTVSRLYEISHHGDAHAL